MADTALDEESTGSGSVGSVLIIDDDTDAGAAVSQALRSRMWQAHHVHTIEEAAVHLQTVTPTIVLLDYRLPGVEGLAGLRRVVQMAAGVPVVLYTGQDADADPGLVAEAIQARAEDVLARQDTMSTGGIARLHSRLVGVRERQRRALDGQSLLVQLVALQRTSIANQQESTVEQRRLNDLIVKLLPAPREPTMAERVARLIPLLPDDQATKLVVAAARFIVVGASLLTGWLAASFGSVEQ